MKTLLKILGILITTIMVVWFGYWLGVDITDQQTLTHSDKMLAIGFDVLLMLSLYVSFIGLVVTGVNKLFKIKK